MITTTDWLVLFATGFVVLLFVIMLTMTPTKCESTVTPQRVLVPRADGAFVETIEYPGCPK